MIASFAAMALLYVLFSKFVPLISIWELKSRRASQNQGCGLSSGGRSCRRADMSAIYGLVQDAASGAAGL